MATNICERVRCPNSYYKGILCEVHVVCPENREIGSVYPHGDVWPIIGLATYEDIKAQSVSGYINLSGYAGDYAYITRAAQVDLRVSGTAVRNINYRLRCQSNGEWIPDIPSGASCVIQKNLTASDSRCQ